jgi:hypothetical protein
VEWRRAAEPEAAVAPADLPSAQRRSRIGVAVDGTSTQPSAVPPRCLLPAPVWLDAVAPSSALCSTTCTWLPPPDWLCSAACDTSLVFVCVPLADDVPRGAIAVAVAVAV